VQDGGSCEAAASISVAAARGPSEEIRPVNTYHLHPSVLVVDHDQAHNAVVATSLRKAGFDVDTVRDGTVAIDRIEGQRPDLVVTERTARGVSGLELCRRMKARKETRATMIMIMAANSDHVDLARALDIGADDFVHKPCVAAEVVARARALVRRARPGLMGERMEYRDIAVEMETLRAYRAGEQLKIGPTEFKLLATFIETPGRVWSRDQLLDKVWGRSSYVDTRTVDVHVGRLRKTLRASGRDDPFRTIRGTGYALG
jgi:two-component system phosphate regulon response regulator PhoB